MTRSHCSLSQRPLSRRSQGYLLIWLGHFKRWRRRFFVASSPGVLVFYKRSNCAGKAYTISLRSATIVRETRQRQFKLLAGASADTTAC